MTKNNDKKDPKSLMDPLTASGYILFDQDFDSDTVKPAIIKIKMNRSFILWSAFTIITRDSRNKGGSKFTMIQIL